MTKFCLNGVIKILLVPNPKDVNYKFASFGIPEDAPIRKNLVMRFPDINDLVASIPGLPDHETLFRIIGSVFGSIALVFALIFGGAAVGSSHGGSGGSGGPVETTTSSSAKPVEPTVDPVEPSESLEPVPTTTSVTSVPAEPTTVVPTSTAPEPTTTAPAPTVTSVPAPPTGNPEVGWFVHGYIDDLNLDGSPDVFLFYNQDGRLMTRPAAWTNIKIEGIAFHDRYNTSNPSYDVGKIYKGQPLRVTGTVTLNETGESFNFDSMIDRDR